VVFLSDASGHPVPNTSVIFKVTQNNGMVSAGGPPASSLVAITNAQGQAQGQWTLGMRSGAGGNAMDAYSVGFGGTALFTATGSQGPAGNIVVDTGNNQIRPIGQALALPLIAVVVDAGNNRLPNVPVTFTVIQGGGSFGGQATSTVTSDSDGRVTASLTLGMQEGNANNLVEANFPSNLGLPAAFTASGRAAGDPAQTTISGVVLDNSNVPIPGVTVRAVPTDVLHSNAGIISSLPFVQTNAQGQFSITQAPVGVLKLMLDGSTAQLPGQYPSLEYDMVTVAGQANTVGAPIYILPLNAANSLCVTATTGGGTLTMADAPGFSLTYAPGQVTFPGGSQTGCISVTAVHPDKVPMVPGFGQQPRFIVTIQPPGAVFNPPAAITLPNVDGLQPRAVTEMYSYDHDISSFVAIGTGVVSDDGQVIRSSPGVGVLKSGWHCGGNPNQTGAAATCPICMFCQGTQCTPQGNGTSCGGTGSCQFTGQTQQPTCGCPTGQLLVNNSQCQTPPNCPTGTTFNVSTGQCCGNGQCYTPPTCTPPQVLVNGTCQTPPNCPPGTTFNASTGQCCGNGQCQCPSGQVSVNGTCQQNCPNGQVPVNGTCQNPMVQITMDVSPVAKLSPNYIPPTVTSSVSIPGGSYQWTSDNPSVLGIAGPSSGGNLASVPLSVNGVGKATLSLTYTLSGSAPVTDSVTFVLSRDAAVVGWIDGSQISAFIPPGVSPDLVAALNGANDLSDPLHGCLPTTIGWINAGKTGNPPTFAGTAEFNVTNDIDRAYANNFLIKYSANQDPGSQIDSLFPGDSSRYRAYLRFQSAYVVRNGSIVGSPKALIAQAVAGITLNPCLDLNPVIPPIVLSALQQFGLSLPSNAPQLHPLNGASGVGNNGTTMYLLNEARVGTDGQAGNFYLNNRTTPWIYTFLQFGLDGNYVLNSNGDVITHQIFPTYNVYEFSYPAGPGMLVSTYRQSTLQTFINLDSTSQFAP
jgi:hypothetical protein